MAPRGQLHDLEEERGPFPLLTTERSEDQRQQRDASLELHAGGLTGAQEQNRKSTLVKEERLTTCSWSSGASLTPGGHAAPHSSLPRESAV